jgi:hypothetical protein
MSSPVLSAFLVVLACALVAGTPFLGKSLIKLHEQKGLFQGDIGMPGERNALLLHSPRKWPNGIVYYDWIGQNWTKDYLDMLSEAMRMIEKHTCIKFVKHTNQPNFINIVDGAGGCYSELVGMLGSRQILSLMKENEQGSTCWGLGTVMHELLHAVGLWHEQMRYDRDDYLEIHEENMKYGTNVQFRKIGANISSTYDQPYNYRSIMHYDAWAFSGNDEPTMTPKKPGVKNEDVGRGEIWEYETDWEKIRRMYDCKGTYPVEPCADSYPSCDVYKDQCNTLGWMRTYCHKTCGRCPSDNCKDDIMYCASYAAQCGKAEWMETSCRKTCSLC